MTGAKRIILVGLVQGVGFRPFIHRLAHRLGLNGYVRNIGGSEVEVWVEGSEERIEEFIERIFIEKPPPAVIEEYSVVEAEPRGYNGFNILPSGKNMVKRSNIPPDFAICEHCLREILDPNDRRYRYAFNSCAWCGPRFSMMIRVPYDRENTSMAKYKLCPECLEEYRDINNIRRYHAQGISCPVDGPRLTLYTRDWELVETSDPIREAAKLIDEGWIVAVKGLGGYHLAVKASCDEPVERLRVRKRRPRKPFAVMGLDLEVINRLVILDDEARRILSSPASPILLLPKHENSPVTPLTSPGLPWEGVFRAYTGLHYLLLMETHDKFAVMTSANITGEPMCIDEECLKKKLSGIVDYILYHDREIINRVDDSVLRRTGDKWVFLRRSRGYAPYWIRVGRDLGGEYIAFGSDLNNTPAIGFEDKIVPLQYIGDQDSLDAQRDLLKYLEYYTRNYHVDPSKAIIVVDKHPGYVSSRLGEKYALEHGSRIVRVQHHYAHLVGAAFEEKLWGRVIGVAIDGVGWGDDDTVWGGEVIVFDTEKPWYRRIGSLEQLPLTSDRDTIYPARLLTGYLALKGYDWDEIKGIVKKLGLDRRVPGGLLEHHAVYRLVTDGKYVPASSTGRFLDLVSVLLGFTDSRSYEGEPAILVEAHAYGNPPVLIEDYKIQTNTNPPRLNYQELINKIINNEYRMKHDRLAASILYSLGYWLGELLIQTGKGTKYQHIVASGGAAVNTYIIQGLKHRLNQDGQEPKLPEKTPVNDGGIGFGQVASAAVLNN